MGAYCELHAVKLPEAEVVHIARADGDSDDDVYLAACELARMCGVDVEGWAGRSIAACGQPSSTR